MPLCVKFTTVRSTVKICWGEVAGGHSTPLNSLPTTATFARSEDPSSHAGSYTTLTPPGTRCHVLPLTSAPDACRRKHESYAPEKYESSTLAPRTPRRRTAPHPPAPPPQRPRPPAAPPTRPRPQGLPARPGARQWPRALRQWRRGQCSIQWPAPPAPPPGARQRARTDAACSSVWIPLRWTKAASVMPTW